MHRSLLESDRPGERAGTGIGAKARLRHASSDRKVRVGRERPVPAKTEVALVASVAKLDRAGAADFEIPPAARRRGGTRRKTLVDFGELTII
jgi:hypothetical protein